MVNQKKVTIYDIATEAGVAASTVSRALSRPDRVSSDTASRIFEIAKNLGYERNGAAYFDTMSLSRTLVFVVADIANPMYSDVITGFQQTAFTSGYATLIINTAESESLERVTIQRVISRVDGVALAASRLDTGSINRIEKQRPLVLLNRYLQGHTCVIPATDRGIAQVCRYLRDLGHRRVLYVSGPEMSWANAMRWRVCSESAPKFGLTVSRTPHMTPDDSSGIAAFDFWCENGRPSAILALNDFIAAGFLREAKAHGVKVPETVSVIGIDNSSLATLVTPELSSLTSASLEIGKRGAEALIWQIEHHSLRERRLFRESIEFVPRGSTGSAPAQ